MGNYFLTLMGSDGPLVDLEQKPNEKNIIMNRTLKRRFHDVEYTVNLSVQADSLAIECENRTLDRWKATFTARFIEEITHRTGNFKPFNVFVKMLASAFDSDSPAVHLDLLTGEDLEALRQASGVTSVNRQVPSAAGAHSKRYLILTYQGEFDKVHYPMALAHNDVEDISQLKRTIVRLREELEAVTRDRGDPFSVHELESLVTQLKADNGRLSKELNDNSVENTKLVDLVESLKADNHTLRVRLESESRMHRANLSRPTSAQSPGRGGLSRSSSIIASPANSLRSVRPPQSSVRIASPNRSSFPKPPTAPVRYSSPSRRRDLSPRPYKSPYAQSSLRSPLNSIRSNPRDISPIRPPRLPIEPVSQPPATLSEVDARLQALQNFLRHQKAANI